MKAHRKSFFFRYGVAALTVAAGFALRAVLNPLLGSDVPFITFFPAVALSALVGGFGAGLFAAFLSVLVVDVFIMDPTPAFSTVRPQNLTQLIVFLTMSGFLSWIVGKRRQFEARLRQVETESQRALRESEERSLLAQKSTGVGIWVWDLMTGEVEWSEGVYNLLGLDACRNKESLNRWLEFIFPEDRERAKQKMEEKLESEATEFYDEFRIIRADSQVRWIAVQGEIIRGPDGRAERVRGVNYDITRRKRSEIEIKHLNHELNRRNKELQAIFDIAPVGIAVARDADCDFISANPALAEMLGVKPGDNISMNPANAAGVPYKHLKKGRELSADELPMQRAVAEGRPILGEEIDIQRADGRIVTIYSYAAPVFDEDGRVVSCIAAQVDITDRKKREREREHRFDIEQALRKEAEEANRLKDEFLATVSHELRTPLNSIQGWVSILRRGDDSLTEQTRARALESIERGARAQSQLIEDLLDVSRIISGKLHLQVKPVELAAVISSAVETLSPAAEAKGIDLRVRISDGGSPVSGDPDRLQQIVWNLLSNAIKFTDRGGRVDIVLRFDADEAEITVSDTGKGIDPEFLPFVFDRFRQADGSITRHFTGLGLGLSIVKHLVELHGGSVQAHSEGKGRGSVFSVRLPLIDVLAFDEKENSGLDPAGNGFPNGYPPLNGLRILIVDDDDQTLEILRVVFRKCRSDVKTAATAAEAFQIAREWHPDVIVSDIGMPGEDGYAFMRKIRNWEKEKNAGRPSIKAVALTAYAHADDRQRALDAGFHLHIPKPVEPLDLAALIQTLAAENAD
jgi:PAS domain S-box-containing protein